MYQAALPLPSPLFDRPRVKCDGHTAPPFTSTDWSNGNESSPVALSSAWSAPCAAAAAADGQSEAARLAAADLLNEYKYNSYYKRMGSAAPAPDEAAPAAAAPMLHRAPPATPAATCVSACGPQFCLNLRRLRCEDL